MANNRDQRAFKCYFPLWGVTLNSEDTFKVGGNVMVFKPYEEEWRTILNTDVLLEYSKFPPSIYGIDPQPCLCITYKSASDSLERDLFEKQNEILEQIHNGVLTLRLIDEGWFQDPTFVEYVLMSNINEVIRNPGPYRQMFLAGFKRGFPPFYEIDTNTLVNFKAEGNRLLEQVEPALSKQIWESIDAYNKSGGNQAVEIAIENFNLSYAPNGHIAAVQRISNLFIALDAIIGGMSLWKRNNGHYLVNTKINNFFRPRLAMALSLGEAEDAHAEAAWMDVEMRALRNSIAHGSANNAEALAELSIARVRSVLRALLKHYIKFSTAYKMQHEEVCTMFSLKKGASLVEGYNKALDLAIDSKIEHDILKRLLK